MLCLLQKAAREQAAKQPPLWLGRSWALAFALSIFIGVIIFVFGFGFGAWASILNFKQQVQTFGAFAACYQCAAPKTYARLPSHTG